MSTQFHALRLPYKVVESVVNITSEYHIDLNSVKVVGSRVIVGEPRCGKVIHVTRCSAAFGKPEKYHVGMYDLKDNRAIYREIIRL